MGEEFVLVVVHDFLNIRHAQLGGARHVFAHHVIEDVELLALAYAEVISQGNDNVDAGFFYRRKSG